MRLLFSLIIFFQIVCSSFSQTDIIGSKDHPIVGRFAGSYIRFYEYNKFNQYPLRLSAINRGQAQSLQKKILEGAVTRIVYQCNKTVSAFELYKSYEKALSDNGFEKIFSCETNACGDGFGNNFPADNAVHIRSYSQDQRYFAGRRSENDSTDVYVSVYVVFTQDGPVARVDIIEIKKMNEGQVQVTAAKIKSDFDKIGKAVIHQVFFETGKSLLMPQSAPALEEITKFLKENPTVNIIVVGHTDNQGGFDSNMILSQRRAEAVVQELVKTYGIHNDQLLAKGVGYLCPVASNDIEAGRAKNRRVELIKR